MCAIWLGGQTFSVPSVPGGAPRGVCRKTQRKHPASAVVLENVRQPASSCPIERALRHSWSDLSVLSVRGWFWGFSVPDGGEVSDELSLVHLP